jgi:hypothetical protein
MRIAAFEQKDTGAAGNFPAALFFLTGYGTGKAPFIK